MAAEIEDRMARLEEHLVEQKMGAEDCLERAETCLAAGYEINAQSWLLLAKMRRERELKRDA